MTSNKIKEKVSILVPIYNIESTIYKNIQYLIEVLSSFLDNFEIILSNDGSSDNSLSEMFKLETKYDNVKIFNSSKNCGKGHALKRALELASGDYIIFCDADMELNPYSIKNFFEILENENADIVIGSKRHKDSIVNYSNIRKTISFIYFIFVKLFFRLPIKDTQTGLKLFKRSAIIGSFPRVLVRRFAYDLELLACCHLNGQKIVSAPIELNANRHFGIIPLSILFSTFVDTLAVFYRLRILKFYDNLFGDNRGIESENKLVSIIIPLKKINNYVIESSVHIVNQTYKNFEIIILPDVFSDDDIKHEIFEDKRLIINATGNKPPATKRHEGVLISKGEIIAFLDDDTYPEINWLENALRAMQSENVEALGGPAVNALNDDFFQAISGYIYSSVLMSGKMVARYVPAKVQYVDDFPSCNFIITRNLYDKVGGFDSNFWPGEDTILCNNIIKENEKILYTPEALVYHHRRSIFFGHFKQLSSYAWHRGCFIRNIGGNSLHIAYFIPSLFCFYLISIAAIFSVGVDYRLKYLSLIPLALYGLMLIGSALSTFSLTRGLFKAFGIFFSHITYGIFFVKGLLKNNN